MRHSRRNFAGRLFKSSINMKKLSTWKGYPVIGDVAEIDAVVSTPGYIALDRDDILSILEADGESFVLTGSGATLEAAWEVALANVQMGPGNITDLAVAVWCNTASTMKSSFSALNAFTLAPDINVKWGIVSKASLPNEYKIVLIGSAKS